LNHPRNPENPALTQCPNTAEVLTSLSARHPQPEIENIVGSSASKEFGLAVTDSSHVAQAQTTTGRRLRPEVKESRVLDQI
jgi:hypothetical protein